MRFRSAVVSFVVLASDGDIIYLLALHLVQQMIIETTG